VSRVRLRVWAGSRRNSTREPLNQAAGARVPISETGAPASHDVATLPATPGDAARSIQGRTGGGRDWAFGLTRRRCSLRSSQPEYANRTPLNELVTGLA